MISKIKGVKYTILSWLVCAFLCFMVENIFAAEFFYDAANYWGRGVALWSGGRLNLLGTSGFRGYVFPLFLGTCGHYAGETGWRMMNAAMISTLFTIVIPYFFRGGGECRLQKVRL